MRSSGTATSGGGSCARQAGIEAGQESPTWLAEAVRCGVRPQRRRQLLPESGSSPKVNSLMAADDLGKPWLSVKNLLVAGIPTTFILSVLLVTAGYFISHWALH